MAHSTLIYHNMLLIMSFSILGCYIGSQLALSYLSKSEKQTGIKKRERQFKTQLLKGAVIAPDSIILQK